MTPPYTSLGMSRSGSHSHLPPIYLEMEMGMCAGQEARRQFFGLPLSKCFWITPIGVTGACPSRCCCRPKFQVSPRKLGERTGVNAIAAHEQHRVFVKAEGKSVLTFFSAWQNPHHKFVESKPVDTHEGEYLFCVKTSCFPLITMWMLNDIGQGIIGYKFFQLSLVPSAFTWHH